MVFWQLVINSKKSAIKISYPTSETKYLMKLSKLYLLNLKCDQL